jgi:dihydroneopterin aldolase
MEAGAGGVTVVKLGGSFARHPALPDWLDALARCAGRIVVVPGGGPFADAVRAEQRTLEFDDGAAHHMALLAMEQYGCALTSLNAALVPADSLVAIQQALAAEKVPVWMPSRLALAADIPASWDVTSDSLAAWLAGQLGARQLLLVKHVGLGAATVRLPDLIARGIIDEAFPAFLNGQKAAVLGPTDQALLDTIIRGGSAIGTRIDP